MKIFISTSSTYLETTRNKRVKVKAKLAEAKKMLKAAREIQRWKTKLEALDRTTPKGKATSRKIRESIANIRAKFSKTIPSVDTCIKRVETAKKQAAKLTQDPSKVRRPVSGYGKVTTAELRKIKLREKRGQAKTK